MGLSLEEAADGILRIVNENMAGALRVDQRPARPRPARVRAGRLRRRRPVHANARRRADGLVPGDRAALAGAAVRAGRPRGRLPQRVRPDADPADREASADGSDDPRRARGPGARVDGRAGHRRRRPAHRVRRRHALSRPGLRDPGAVGGAGARGSRSASTNCTSSSTASGCRTRRRRSSTCAPSAPATGPQPELPEEEPRAAAREGSPARRRRRATTAPAAPGIIPGPSIVTEFDSTTVILDGYVAEVDRYFNLLIRRGVR